LRYLISVDKTVIVRGPASFKLIGGHATILGAPLDQSSNIVIQRDRQLPIESEDEAEIEITIGRPGNIMEIDGSSVPDSWRKVVNLLESLGKAIVMIVGPADAGKSTLCTYVMNSLITRGREVRVLDADIGQADIGPPTTIASSAPTIPSPTLAQLEPERVLFVGHNTPSFVQEEVFQGIKRMLSSDCRGVTIVNTDGWVCDAAAILYKRHLISIVNPDKLVGIGPRNSLNPILHPTISDPIMVESSKVTRPRTRVERREIRRSGYLRFLTNSIEHTLKLDNTELKLRRGITEARSRGTLNLSKVLLGFLNDKGFMIQIGILETMTHNHLTVYSRRIHRPFTIKFGYVRLARDGRELGFLE